MDALHKLQLNQVQLDELYAVREGEVSEAEAVERLSRSPHWVWTVIDPESTWLLSVQVGERTLARARPCRTRSCSYWHRAVCRFFA